MFEVIFLGSGVSTAIPCITCILQRHEFKCPVCEDAFFTINSKNKRNNVSIAIKFVDQSNENRCVLIDAGKTMRDSILKQFPRFNLTKVDAMFLTHGHADAILGLDDVRDLQSSEMVTICDDNTENIPVTGFKVTSGPLPIYLHNETMQTINSTFDYLTCEPTFLNRDQNVLERRVALLDFIVIHPISQLDVFGLKIKTFPVFHGGTYVSL